VTVDPLPGLVEGRLRILNGGQNDRERRLDEALRRARRLDEEIVRTVATCDGAVGINNFSNYPHKRLSLSRKITDFEHALRRAAPA
jgi:hypothetical protein